MELNGTLQANSIGQANGVIDAYASDSLTLGGSSDIEAHGDNTSASASPGGFVTLQAGNTFSDTAGSTINVAGGTGAGGGQNGIVEIFGNNLDGTMGDNLDANSVHSSIGNPYALLINPYDLALSSTTDTSSSNPSLNVDDLSAYSQIDLHALDNIELSAFWNINDLSAPGTVSLLAGNNIILDDGMAIQTGMNMSVNLTAGAQLAPGSLPASGNDGIYLNGNSYIFTLNGEISLSAPNEVIVNSGSVTTFGGGNISVTTQYGDVNTGTTPYAYDFGQATAPYYSVDFLLGGISTGAGGNLTINAGGNVISFLPIQTGNPQDYLNAQYDGGSGAFGPEKGNVTINAGGNAAYGHYVVANGVGSITAGGDIGAPVPELADNPGEGFALSLIKGSWSVYAPNGNIYVQDVRNPNGIFGETAGLLAGNYPGYHNFDYAPDASLFLDAGNAVEFTGFEAPHFAPSNLNLEIPFLLPPELNVIAGAGGFILDTSVILFPSPDQGLSITTLHGGNFGIPNTMDPYSATPVTVEMSDSSATRWVDATSFQTGDQPAASTPNLPIPTPSILIFP